MYNLYKFRGVYGNTLDICFLQTSRSIEVFSGGCFHDLLSSFFSEHFLLAFISVIALASRNTSPTRRTYCTLVSLSTSFPYSQAWELYLTWTGWEMELDMVTDLDGTLGLLVGSRDLGMGKEMELGLLDLTLVLSSLPPSVKCSPSKNSHRIIESSRLPASASSQNQSHHRQAPPSHPIPRPWTLNSAFHPPSPQSL